ncbi:MAG: hypothetical protein DCO96_01850 [Fluviicola sp. XM-24bin1]|nr:MAG: hypothetical protein DCO96_01850 [Fluviicola sp. XM-24bin1]
MKKLSTNTTESDLLRARKEGLERARSLEAMRPLGKWKSMDVFAWANPHFDALATVIANFPFPVVWVGKQSQIKCAVRYYPEVLDTIETVVVSDFGGVKLSGEEIYTIDNVAGIGDVQSSLDLVRSFEDARRVFLFTTEGEGVQEELNLLEEYIYKHG